MKIEAIIFDLDGTLLDSLTGISYSMNLILKSIDCPTFSNDEYKTFIGNGSFELVKKCLPKDRIDQFDIEQILHKYREVYEQIWKEKTEIYPGIPKLLSALSSKGRKMAILSNKTEYLVKSMVNESLPEWNFEIVCGANEGTPLKPDPASTLKIIEQMGVSAAQTAFMGDSGIDMLVATRANAIAIGALWGYREATELLKNGALHLINHPLELLELDLFRH